MKTSEARFAMLAALALSSAGAADGRAWREVAPDHVWSFPEDHRGHDGFRSEWWYFTGHLDAVDGSARRFGYQFTLFRVGLVPTRPALESAWATDALVLGHASLGDLDAGEHRFSEVLRRSTPFLGGFPAAPDPVLAWVLAPAGTPGRWEVALDDDGFRFRMRDDVRGMAFDLAVRPEKPLVLQGPNGYSRKSDREGAASHYYSFTRLATAGTLTIDGRAVEVEGRSWMDKEFSSDTITGGQVGWDWFSLQLDDGRDLMLFVLRREDGSVDFASGNVIAADGAVRPLVADAWTFAVEGRWTSPTTGTSYPARWTIDVPSESLNLDVVPAFSDQENVSSVTGGLAYWEGAVDVRDRDGRGVGRGYVELTGYGEGNRPPI